MITNQDVINGNETDVQSWCMGHRWRETGKDRCTEMETVLDVCKVVPKGTIDTHAELIAALGAVHAAVAVIRLDEYPSPWKERSASLNSIVQPQLIGRRFSVV